MTISGANFGWTQSDVVAVLVGTAAVPSADWLFVSSNTIQITSLPAPVSEDPQNVVDVGISVQLRSGRNAISEDAQRLAYILPTKAPAIAPRTTCVAV